jgi:hypothetical protein
MNTNSSSRLARTENTSMHSRKETYSMTNQELDRALRQLRLGGMADVLAIRAQQARADNLGPLDFLGMLVHDELERRRDRLVSRRVRAVIEKGPASVIKVPPPEATYLAAGWALPASGPRRGKRWFLPQCCPPVVGPRRDVGWAVQCLERQDRSSEKVASTIRKRTAWNLTMIASESAGARRALSRFCRTRSERRPVFAGHLLPTAYQRII